MRTFDPTLIPPPSPDAIDLATLALVRYFEWKTQRANDRIAAAIARSRHDCFTPDASDLLTFSVFRKWPSEILRENFPSAS